MKDQLIKLIEEEDFLNQDIYTNYPFLKQERQHFNQIAKSICLKNQTFQPDLEDTLAQQTNQIDTTQLRIGGKSEQNTDSFALETITKFICEQWENSLKQKINLKDNSHFYGLKDNVIELDQPQLEDFKIITFLIPGNGIEKNNASENFGLLENCMDIESQKNLFVFFKWQEDISILQIASKLLKTFVLEYENKKNYQEYLENFLNYYLGKFCLNKLKRIVYQLIQQLKICIKLPKLAISILRNIIDLFEKALDSIIKYFQDTYQRSIDFGIALAEYLNNWNLIGNLQIDFLGYDYGTVVIAQALKRLVNPARYIILMGGVAKITDIEQSYKLKRFKKCCNFYSTNDIFVETFIQNTNLLGDQLLIGVNSICEENKDFFSNYDTEIGCSGYINKYKELYDKAMTTFKNGSSNEGQNKKRQSNNYYSKIKQFYDEQKTYILAFAVSLIMKCGFGWNKPIIITLLVTIFIKIFKMTYNAINENYIKLCNFLNIRVPNYPY
ncbi:hypothetical protein TTHERM_00782120 (macronuclear) [Tetrahymena thermophila SB210]|uniref:Uncharacterized protein n=1 Tax=Tetrahymena thermophila (strain SB210) TaxID=312017 RepID=Q231S9_TETTS|nr:hypothetical protein TTHERM_00782120 [Tetrahymena thermophila SB210]EAR91223.2 hypothetical protein TTHERM_00782120 [Tetrahymena thermophila SB210]|eukprot:XP_001011468.2 hypothetical protein TTHERM_00782120 [Tetrahymena thermophila SB210]